MKHERITPEMAEQLARRDRIKLILMAAAVILIGGGYFLSQRQAERYGSEPETGLPRQESEPEPIAEGRIPPFDLWEVLEEVRDGQPSERVVVEPAALNVVFDYGRILTPRQYEAIGARELDGATYDQLLAEPGEQRVKPFQARGRIEILKKRRRSESRPEEYAGTLLLETGRPVHFVVLEIPEGLGVGDWARVDGMFLKLHRVEAPDPSAGWLEGPLLCGPELIPSYAPIAAEGAVAAPALDEVTDDDLDRITGLPHDAQWQLMARAKSPDPGTDWASAPVLDGQLMGEILADGDAFRGQPMVVELSQNLGCWTERAGENPLRLERVTKGWIGNQTWKGPVPVIHFIAPSDQPELRERYGEARFLEARGYFFKNWAYRKADGGLGLVPVFVMDRVVAKEVVSDPMPERIKWAIFTGAVLMVGLLTFLLLRDRRRAAELQAELVRRRRARRAQGDRANSAQPSTRST